jgi:taurine dioxygenase
MKYSVFQVLQSAVIVIAFSRIICRIGVYAINVSNGSSDFVVNNILEGTFGAEIIGINLETVDEILFERINHYLLENKVLVIRNQTHLSVEGLRRFTKYFGPLHVHLESASHLHGYTDVNVVSNIKNEAGQYIGLHGRHVELLHSDLSWAPLPTKVTVLHSVIRSDNCGDTVFANSNAAYDALDDQTKSLLAGLNAYYSYLKHRDLSNITKDGLTISETEKALNASIHPVITVHPITGRKNIYANPSHTVSIVGMEKNLSDEILNMLYTHTADSRFSYVHKWRDFDVVIWDNRGSLFVQLECIKFE